MSNLNDWQRLSVRDGRRKPATLSEGFSPAATRGLVHWLEGELGYRTAGRAFDFDGLILSVALVCDIELDPERTWDVSLLEQLLNPAAEDDELMLDVLDATLAKSVVHSHKTLHGLLRDAASVWTVTEDGRSLVRRVGRAAEVAYSDAVGVDDPASNELSEAWVAMYGTSPNYSDAWDHAIKAMEAALVPIVAPKNPRATLGTVTAELEKGVKFVAFALGSVETLGAVTRLAWPNPDRHGGGQGRAPEEDETSGVVHLAVTVVQWVRNGVVFRQEPS
nr:hypothetical protein [Microbacterium testaceum]